MDFKDHAIKGLKNVTNLLTKDLEALPEEAFEKHFGGKARTVADIIYEVNAVSDHLGMLVRGEKTPEDSEGWITAPPDFRGKQKVIAAFQETTNNLIQTFEGFTQEQLLEPVETERGPTTRYQRCLFAAIHIWYHTGQVNYVQTLLGDDAWHWK